jgi:soluble lytic murein transglycosylase-like protein
VRALRPLVPIICVGALVFAGSAAYAPSPAPAPGTYVVARGDNLTTIARRFGTSVGALAAANRLDPKRILREGTRLSLPAAPARLRPDRAALVPHFRYWAAANRLPVDLLMATTWLESGWQNHVVSPVGAVGIGQLMPGTTAFIREVLIGVPALDPKVPEHNIRMSARYLRWLIERNGGNEERALQSYYQGPHSIEVRGPYGETLHYVRGVQAIRRVFRSGGFPASS